MHGDMLGFIAFDFILRLVRTGVMRVPLVIHVSRMDPDDPAADMPGLGIPRDVITGFEAFSHVILTRNGANPFTVPRSRHKAVRAFASSGGRHAPQDRAILDQDAA